jgi:PiT family inorganic phosphate transporter
MAWAIGANDVANAMGTSLGSGAITIGGALVIAGVFEFAGAVLAGGHVTDTVRRGMLDMEIVAQNGELLLHGMLASLAAAATLLVAATFWGMPVSTTHAIVGAIVGFDAVAWGKVTQILLSWITSPLLGGLLAFLTFTLIRFLILDREHPMENARRHGPFFFFFVFFTIGLVTLFKGLKNMGLDYDLAGALLRSALLGLVGAGVGWVFLRRVRGEPGENRDDEFASTERVFVVLQILTACAVCFAHGSNDVANAIGPLAAVVNVAQGAAVGSKAALTPWMLVVGGAGIVIGLATWGYRVMETVGRKITPLTPSRGFAAVLAVSTTIVLASRLGIPVSTTHIIVGAVLGVGLARGIAALDLRVVRNIVVSWVVTLPIAAMLSVFFYYFFQGFLGT